MALLFMDSFDHYQTAQSLAKWSGGQYNHNIVVGGGRCGTNAMDLTAPSDLFRGIAFSGTTAIVGFAWKNRSTGDPGRVFTFFDLADQAGTLYGSLQYNADGSLEAFAVAGSTVSAGITPPGLIHYDVWYFIELGITLGASGTAVFTLRVNNVQQFSTTTNTTNVGLIRRVHFKCTSFAGFSSYYIDDFYALDATGPAPGNSFLGDCRVEYLRPRAAGSQQQWPFVVGTSHWAAVDDNASPDDDTTYVEANAPGLTDTNRYQPTGLPAGPIFGAQLSLYARKTEIGPRTIAPVVNGVSGPSYGPSFESYQYYSTPYATNPATGLPWTIAEINAVQAGVTVIT